MLDSFFLIGAGLTMAGVVALANPALMGWRSRRDALTALGVALLLLSLAWLARQVEFLL